MKRFFVFYLLALIIATSNAWAQDLTQKDVPAAVATTFSSKFPDAADVKWKKNKSGKYEADFKLAGKKAEAKFTADGNWDSTEKRIDAKDLPGAATTYLKENYGEYKVDAVEWKEDIDASKNVYEVKLKKDKAETELEFNAEGKFLKKKDKDKDKGKKTA